MFVRMDVLYEDNHIICINKKPSEIIQGDKTGDTPLSEMVKQYLKDKYGKPGNVFLGVVHRIDRPSSGVVVFAKTGKALSRLNRSLQEGTVNKTYWAVVKEPPPHGTGTLTHYLIKNRKQNKSYAYDEPQSGAKKAVMTYTHLCSLKNYHVLEIELLTGRHHQIRAQLAHIGLHIKGDIKYGAARTNDWPGIHLHARELCFDHPVKRRAGPNQPLEDLNLQTPAPDHGPYPSQEQTADGATQHPRDPNRVPDDTAQHEAISPREAPEATQEQAAPQQHPGSATPDEPDSTMQQVTETGPSSRHSALLDSQQNSVGDSSVFQSPRSDHPHTDLPSTAQSDTGSIDSSRQYDPGCQAHEFPSRNSSSGRICVIAPPPPDPVWDAVMDFLEPIR
jgi:23S rRNA pseudouridine1911/1915/1917 synthase